MDEYIVAHQRTWLLNSHFGPGFPTTTLALISLCSAAQGSSVPRVSLAGFQAPWNCKALVDMGTGLGRGEAWGGLGVSWRLIQFFQLGFHLRQRLVLSMATIAIALHGPGF